MKLIPVSRAREIILESVKPLKSVFLPLDEARGNYLASPVMADRDSPPADKSAMDGYAVRSADSLQPGAVLKLIGEVPAGHPATIRVLKGTCVRILTGALIPPGADSVLMVEHSAESGGAVTVRIPPKQGANILRRGEDAKKGKILLTAGTRLDSAQVGVCAMTGTNKVQVVRRPRVFLIGTGAELRAPDTARLATHEIRNSTGPALSAALAEWGFQSDGGNRTVRDDLEKITSAIKDALKTADVVLLTGGVSVGKYDYVTEAVKKAGGKIRFHGVAMKPGKPILFATASGGKLLFGLPGNPLSTMTGFNEFVLPSLRLLSGAPKGTERPVFPAELGDDVQSKGDRERFLLMRVSKEKSHERGRLVIEPVRTMSSADFAAGGLADGVIPMATKLTKLKKGTRVEFHPWRPFLGI